MIHELFERLPNRRLKAVDGMAVTADIWEEAHAFHRKQTEFLSEISVGGGIVSGLEVIASDPPDSSMYILPGVAIDPLGRVIQLTRGTAYDIGTNMEGTVYLILTYSESQPRAEDGHQEPDRPLFVSKEFGIEVRSTLPEGPYVELARVRRETRDAPLLNAEETLRPGVNEIDLRFRRGVGRSGSPVVQVGVSYLGNTGDRRHGRGLDNLARFLRQSGDYQVWVDDALPLDAALTPYSLLCLVGLDTFELAREEMDAIYRYLQDGGTLFIESCRQDHTRGTPPADKAFSELLDSFGVELQELSQGDSLLTRPHLFAAPPPGFAGGSHKPVMVGEGVIYSYNDFGCLWQGERRGDTPSREEIRAALEWGANIVTRAAERREQVLAERRASAVLDADGEVLSTLPATTMPESPRQMS